MNGVVRRGATNVTTPTLSLSGNVRPLPDPPEPPPPPSPSHTYHHGFTWIEDPPFFSLDLAEFETVAGSWWNGSYAWWRDACCAGWAYAIANDYMPHWQTNTPVIRSVELECGEDGPARCIDITTAIFEETWTIAGGDFADCGKPPDQDNAVFLQHGHHLTKDGIAQVVFTMIPCPHLYPHHVNFTDSYADKGVYLTSGPSASISG